jgi:hypothetical protein
MPVSKLGYFVFLGLLLAPMSPALASTWEDAGLYHDQGKGQDPEHGAISPEGDLFITSAQFEGQNDDAPTWIVLRMKASESTLKKVDHFELGPNKHCWANNVFFRQEKIFVTGRCVDSLDSNFALLRVSVDGGETWSIADQFQLSENSSHDVYQSATQTDNAIFLTTRSQTSEGFKGTVRRSLDNGLTFQTVDVIQHEGLPTQSWGVAAIDSNQIVSLSRVSYGPEQVGLLFRKSEDGGDTWKTVSVLKEENLRIRGFRIRANSHGLFVLGASIKENVFRAAVLKSADGGLKWAESDVFRPENSDENFYYDVFEDIANQSLWSSGYTVDSLGITNCVLRKSTDGGSSWETEVLYSGKYNLGGVCTSMMLNSEGNLLVIGKSRVAPGESEIFVRKLN